jgi:subtilisin family serine protease
MKILKSALIIILAGALAGLIFAANKPQAPIKLNPNSLKQASVKVWIFFTDKGSGRVPLSKRAAITDKAERRRALRGAPGISDELDREVNQVYVDSVQPFVRKIANRSRWLTAVSAIVDTSNLARISRFGFVREVREVAVYRQKLEPILSPDSARLLKQESPSPPEYGPSYNQLSQIQATDLRARGLEGEGVTLLILDTGFNLHHPCFDSLDFDSTYDFINGDTDVEDFDKPGEPAVQRDHGTATLSCIAGYSFGDLVGAARKVKVLAAKTEIVLDEIKIEEDNWVAGIEWGERLGADVVSSSLGYTNWYTYHDMDGNTAVTTKAADIAASLGLIVCNSVGNDFRTSPEPTLIAPSDGDSVIAVGAVDAGGEITLFSSNGPSYDGRIKPDLCAKGAEVSVALSTGGFGFEGGTSFSCPLTAGVVCLLLQAHPDWDYGKIYHALIATATQAGSPDNVYGYGIVQGRLAADYSPTTTTSGVNAYPNPFSSSIKFSFTMKSTGTVTMKIYTVAGEEVNQAIGTFSLSSPQLVYLVWNGLNAKGEDAAAGVYVALITGPGFSETKKVVKI